MVQSLPSFLALAIPAWIKSLNPSKFILPVLLGSTSFFPASFSASVGSGPFGKFNS
jgi:hypothetical protein